MFIKILDCAVSFLKVKKQDAGRAPVISRFQLQNLLTLILLGAYSGLFWYLCGGEVSRYTLFGVTYLVFIFNCLAANLRHTHIWLSFGPLQVNLGTGTLQALFHRFAARDEAALRAHIANRLSGSFLTLDLAETRALFESVP